MAELAIFWVFFKVSLISVGGVFGVLPELERVIVIDHQWLTQERFVQAYALSQFAPGPNMVMCPLIGYWVGGWSGAIAGFFGIYTLPILTMGGIWRVYQRFPESHLLRRVELSLRPIVIGFMLASCLRLWSIQSSHQLVTSSLLSGLGLMILWRFKHLDLMAFVFLFGIIWVGLGQLIS